MNKRSKSCSLVLQQYMLTYASCPISGESDLTGAVIRAFSVNTVSVNIAIGLSTCTFVHVYE